MKGFINLSSTLPHLQQIFYIYLVNVTMITYNIC